MGDDSGAKASTFSRGRCTAEACPWADPSFCSLPQVWSLSEQGTLLDVLEGVGAPASLLVRGGILVASASSKSSSVKIWDLRSTQKPRPPAPFLDRTGLAAVSHHGSYVYFPKVGDKNKVTIWDLAEGV